MSTLDTADLEGVVSPQNAIHPVCWLATVSPFHMEKSQGTVKRFLGHLRHQALHK